MVKVFFILLSILCSGVSAFPQEFQYQFKDSPSPEANVIVTKFKRVGRSTSARLVGRVFNRGEATAKNVVIEYQVRNPHGVTKVKGKINAIPKNMPGKTFADFNGRIVGITDFNGLSIHTEPKWRK